eukprot:m.445736 g.445736  ORF g.445736 m.445736 type:complete len:133 (-) comp19271_c0_seq1:806-1204(-)
MISGCRVAIASLLQYCITQGAWDVRLECGPSQLPLIHPLHDAVKLDASNAGAVVVVVGCTADAPYVDATHVEAWVSRPVRPNPGSALSTESVNEVVELVSLHPLDGVGHGVHNSTSVEVAWVACDVDAASQQ